MNFLKRSFFFLLWRWFLEIFEMAGETWEILPEEQTDFLYAGSKAFELIKPRSTMWHLILCIVCEVWHAFLLSLLLLCFLFSPKISSIVTFSETATYPSLLYGFVNLKLFLGDHADVCIKSSFILKNMKLAELCHNEDFHCAYHEVFLHYSLVWHLPIFNLVHHKRLSLQSLLGFEYAGCIPWVGFRPPPKKGVWPLNCIKCTFQFWRYKEYFFIAKNSHPLWPGVEVSVPVSLFNGI